MKRFFTAESGFTGALWFAAALVYPLVWVAAWRSTPFYGDFQLFAAPVFTLLMLMAATGCGGRIVGAFRSGDWRDRSALILSGSLLALDSFRQLAGSPEEFCPGSFVPAAYLAGVALAPAWKKLTPVILGGAGVVMVIFTAVTAHNYGFFGNWNWSATMTVAALPATVALFYRGKYFRWIAAGAVVLFLALIAWREIDTFPRGTVIALVFALALTLNLRNQPADRRYRLIIGIVSAILVTAAILVAKSGTTLDYRIQLYRGSWQLLADHWLVGCGPGKFEELIGIYLPRLYHFVRFTAERHTHPHNEMLYLLTTYGVAGGIFCLAALGRAAKNFAVDSKKENYLLWVALLLFFHGQLDVLLAEPAIGMLFWATLGALGTPDEVAAPTAAPLKILALFLSLFFFVAALNTGAATWLFRAAKNSPADAEAYLEKSLRHQTRRETLYLLAVRKFNRGDLAGAEAELRKLHAIAPFGYVHSYGILARILAARGERGEASFAFGAERRRFPYSALNAYYYLVFCKEIGAVPEQEEAAKNRLLFCLKYRGLSEADLPELLFRHNEWDARPLDLQLAPGSGAAGNFD